jgi:hypothetical protein
MRIKYVILVLGMMFFLPVVSVAAQHGKVPIPLITKSVSSPGASSSDGISVIDGNDYGFNSTWDAIRGNGTAGAGPLSDGEGLYTNIQANTGNNLTTLVLQFASPYDGKPVDGVYSLYVDCAGIKIPVNLCNCTSFDESTSNVTYVGDLPTFTNTFTFHDIAIDTHGHGPSNVTLTFAQQFVADWNEMTITMGTIVDLSNTSLFFQNGTELKPGAQYSFTLAYSAELTNNTESQILGVTYDIEPSEITGNGIFFWGNNSIGSLYNITDFTLGNTFTEEQGTKLISNRTSDTQISTVQGSPGVTSYYCWCSQMFDNLTYGVTTAIDSNQTIESFHIITTSPENLEIPIVVTIVVVLALVAGMVALALVRRRRQNDLPLDQLEAVPK